MRNLLIAAAAVAALTGGAAAQDSRVICSEPVKPTCVSSEITFQDQQRIDRCKRDVERFEADIDGYIDCLQDKIARQDSRREAVREEFECRLEGREDC